MDIKGFMYALAKREDSAELRTLGAELMKAVWECGDPALALGFLINDWMALVGEHGSKVDGPVDALLASPPACSTLN